MKNASLTCVMQVPMAKASIYWLVGEYCSLVPKIAPDVLRKAAKAFPNEVCVCVTPQFQKTLENHHDINFVPCLITIHRMTLSSYKLLTLLLS